MCMSPSLTGRYEGRAVVELLDEGRVVSLVEAFAYVDHLNQRWDVPSGAKVDGASIPRALWTIIGGPFEGKYRNASIVHDWFCDRRTRPWERVHEIFYEAMLTSGVSSVQARILYTGVRFGGPRWSLVAVDNNNLGDIKVGAPPPPPAPMAPPMGPPPTASAGRFPFPWPSKPTAAPPSKKSAPPTPVKPAIPSKPVAYSYGLKESDLETIKAIANKDLDLKEIDEMVEHELAGRKRS